MADYLLDTGILIRHLRNRRGYRELLHRLAQGGNSSSLPYRLEVIQGMRDHEREATFALLDALQTHPLDAPTADLAGEVIRTWRKTGIALGGPDAVIAASALRCGATLVTTNPRHFPMGDLPVLSVGGEGNLPGR